MKYLTYEEAVRAIKENSGHPKIPDHYCVECRHRFIARGCTCPNCDSSNIRQLDNEDSENV